MTQTTNGRGAPEKRLGVALLALALAMAWAIAVPAQEEEPADHPGFLAAKGRVTYRVYCANCHGPEGKGNGNIAQLLTVQPTDVTLLSLQHDGKFPKQRVVEVIDGRKQVRGHGSKEMPIWGDVFQSPLAEQTPAADEAGEERARRKIQELVAYIEAIQAKDEAGAPRGSQRGE